jgi:sugar phosphate permease
MTQWFTIKERGVIMGFWCTCYQIGSVLASWVAAYCLAKWGLRSVMTVPAAMLLVIAVIYIIFHKDSPRSVGLPEIEEYNGGEPEAPATVEEQARTSNERSMDVVREVLSYPMVWFMGLSYFCLKFVRYSLLFWLPLYMTKKLGYEPSLSGWLSSIPEIAGFLGGIFAGYVSDKLMGARRAPICAIMFLGLAGACWAQSYLSVMGLVPMMLGMSLVYFMIFGPDTIMTGAAAMDFGSKKGAATAAGFINGLGSIGAAVQEPLLGFLAVKYGYDYFFYLFIPLSIIPFFLMLSQWNAKPKTA